MKLHVAITVGLLAGLAFGLLAAATGSPALRHVALGAEPLGTAFVNLLKMVVIPLVGSTLFVGVAGIGDLRRIGSIGGRTLGFFALTTLASVLIGMGTMWLLLPLADQEAARTLAGTGAAAGAALPGMVDFLVGLVPSNPFRAAAEGALLPLIVFTALFAAAASSLPERQRAPLIAAGEAITAALVKLVHWVLWAAPVGVFALAAPITATSGVAILQSLAVFILAVAVGLAVFATALYLPAARVLGRQRPGRFLQAAAGSLLIGATTTSQPATIPAMLQATDDLGIPRTISSMAIPLGASLNHAGSALFQGAALVFLAWLYGTPLPPAGIAGAVIAVCLVSFTVTGVPSASVVSLAPALSHAGVPLDGLGVLLGVDRIPDMLRTAVNVMGTIAGSVVADPGQPSTAARSPSAPHSPPTG